jgi:hypothetical protein
MNKKIFLPPSFTSHYLLARNETESFQNFWVILHSLDLKNRKFLDVAVSRFRLAQERLRPEDEIIDLMIASEALFLCDVNDDPYRGEFRYRQALRAGCFLGCSQPEKKQIFDHMRGAYDVRSAIVHGGEPELPSGFTILEEFVATIEEHIRRALKKAVTLAYDPKNPIYLLDWNELVLPSSER